MRFRTWNLFSAGLAGLAFAAAGAAQPPPSARDFSKGRIEQPTEQVLAQARLAEALARAEARARAEALANPKVEPGKVKWHADLDAACAAAAKSGKPVLVFHMMGKLDDQFC
jgi:hypothetical protein